MPRLEMSFGEVKLTSTFPEKRQGSDIEKKIVGLFTLLFSWCTISFESLSQIVFLKYCPKNDNKGDKYQNTVFNPSVTGLKIRYLKKKPRTLHYVY